jgi:hypothetical protein
MIIEYAEYDTQLLLECDDGTVIDSDDYVDTTKSVDWNISNLYVMGDFEPEDIAEILGITLFRVAQCLAPHGLDFPEFNDPCVFDEHGNLL